MAERKPCKSCGSTRVDREVVRIDREREYVIVTCASCENRRATYTRKAARGGAVRAP